MSQITRKIIRLPIDLSQPLGSQINDALTSNPPVTFVANDLEVDVALFASVKNGVLYDIGNYSYMQIDLKPPGGITQSSQVTLVSAQSGQPALDNTTTVASWQAGTNQHAAFQFTSSSLNFGNSADATYQLVISGATIAGKLVTFGVVNIIFKPTGIGAGGSPIPTPPTYYTGAQSDARYLILAGSGQTVTNLTSFSAGLNLAGLSMPAAGQALSLSGFVGPANSNTVPVAPYLGPGNSMPVSGAANFGPNASQTSVEAIDVTHYHAVRQNGTITAVSFYIPALTGITAFYVKIWRTNSAGTYDLVGVSENFASALVVGTTARNLSSPITGVREGDWVGFRAEYSGGGGATAQNFFSQASLAGASATLCYTVTSVSALAGTYNWAGQTSNAVAMPLQVSMSAPFMVAFGDSLMSGRTAHLGYADIYTTVTNSPQDSLPYYVGRMLGVTYQNMAHAGYTMSNTQYCLSNLVPTEVNPLKPRFCLIEGGNNDFFNGYLTNTGTVTTAWAAALASLQGAGITPVILLIPPSRNYSGSSTAVAGYIDTVNAWLLANAAAYGAIVADPRPAVGIYTSDGPAGNYWALQTQYDSGDGVHLNSAGYAKMAQIIAQAVAGLTINGRVVAGAALLYGNLVLDGLSIREISVGRNTNYETAGAQLTVQAGGATAYSTNLSGGTLVLSSGISTGTGVGKIQINTAPAGSSGTGDNTPTKRLLIQQTGGYAQSTLSGDTGNGAQFILSVNGGTPALSLYAPTSGSVGIASGSGNPQPIISIDSSDNVMVEYTLTVGSQTVVSLGSSQMTLTSAGLTRLAIQSTGSNDAQVTFYNGATYKAAIGFQQSTGKLAFYSSGSASAPGMTMDSNGNISNTGTATFANTTTITTGGLTVSAGGAAITGNSSVTGTLLVSGALTHSSIPVFNGTCSTGSGTATIGSTNCPAVTVSAVYKWISVVTSDGSACFVPAWK